MVRVTPVNTCRIVERRSRVSATVSTWCCEEGAHLTNTGSLRGVLEPGSNAVCTPKERGRLRYRVLGVVRGRWIVVVDTGLHMTALEEAVALNTLPWLRGCTVKRREAKVGGSRLDYLLDCGRPAYLEVKSAVLEVREGYAAYPEPASPRGRRHVRVLMEFARRGFRAILLFVASQPNARAVVVNEEADPQLPCLLSKAVEAGVEVYAVNVLGMLAGSVLEVNVVDVLPVVF